MVIVWFLIGDHGGNHVLTVGCCVKMMFGNGNDDKNDDRDDDGNVDDGNDGDGNDGDGNDDGNLVSCKHNSSHLTSLLFSASSRLT